MAKRICPKCNLGEMYATGGGYNYRCPLCGHTYHESRPRPHISSGPTYDMNKITGELEDSLSEVRRLNEERKQQRREEKYQREYEKRERKAQKARQKKEKKSGISFGTIIGIIFVLWLLSQFFSYSTINENGKKKKGDGLGGCPLSS